MRTFFNQPPFLCSEQLSFPVGQPALRFLNRFDSVSNSLANLRFEKQESFICSHLRNLGAKGGTRTPMPLRAPDPKSGASAKFRHFRTRRISIVKRFVLPRFTEQPNRTPSVSEGCAVAPA